MADTATIYARVPLATKDAAAVYATSHGLTFTAGLQELLGRGLEAVQDETSIASLQARADQLELDVREASLKAREEAGLRAQAEQELESVRQATAVWAQRADLIIGSCPSCHEPVTGRDVLVEGHCARCQASTTSLMQPKTNGVDNNELMLVLGGVGLLLGLLVVGRKAI